MGTTHLPSQLTKFSFCFHIEQHELKGVGANGLIDKMTWLDSVQAFVFRIKASNGPETLPLVLQPCAKKIAALDASSSILRGENPIAAGRQPHDIADLEFPVPGRVDLDRGRRLRQLDFGALDRAEASDMRDLGIERTVTGQPDQ